MHLIIVIVIATIAITSAGLGAPVGPTTISTLSLFADSSNENGECKDGVCALPPAKQTSSSSRSSLKTKLLDLEKGMKKSDIDESINTDREEIKKKLTAKLAAAAAAAVPASAPASTQPDASHVSVSLDPVDVSPASSDELIADSTIIADGIGVSPPHLSDTDTSGKDNISDNTSPLVADPADLQEKVDEMAKLGYSSDESARALASSRYDVDEALAMLAQEDERNTTIAQNAEELFRLGWSKEAASFALRESSDYRNISEALAMLEEEEQAIRSQFDGSVADLVANGWDEFIARQSLLAQWTLDQRRAMGFNDTVPPEVLASIAPSLRRSNETKEAGGATATEKAKKKTSSQTSKADAKSAGKSNAKNQPTPAKREECVFDVNANNFQKVVMESPVPVLVDIYADWCGPCKQLGPMLEEASMKSGGMFRLAKVNSDNERAIAELLGVTGLPTVFAVNKGRLSDRFVGMLPSDQLQAFLVRVVTGYGERVQGNDISENELSDMSLRLANMAGLSSITFQKKEKLFKLVEEALAMEGAWGEQAQGVKISDAVRTALLYLKKAAEDIRNNKYRSISVTSTAFRDKVQPSPAALQILRVAGFRPENSSTPATEVDKLVLQHYNVAILNMVSQRVFDLEGKKKFSAVKQGVATSEQSSKPIISESKSKSKSEKPVKAKKTETAKDAKATASASTVKSVQSTKKSGLINLSVKLGSVFKPLRGDFSSSQTLESALESLIPHEYAEGAKMEISFPFPKRELKKGSKEFKQSLKELAGEKADLVISVLTNNAANESPVQSSSTSLSPKRKGLIGRIFSLEKKDKKSKSASSAATSSSNSDKSGNDGTKGSIANSSTTTTATPAGKATSKGGSKQPTKSKPPKRKGAHTLFSTGILSAKTKKHNEYFGGDSTVVQAGPDPDEEPEGEPEEAVSEEETGAADIVEGSGSSGGDEGQIGGDEREDEDGSEEDDAESDEEGEEDDEEEVEDETD